MSSHYFYYLYDIYSFKFDLLINFKRILKYIIFNFDTNNIVIKHLKFNIIKRLPNR